MEPQVQMMNEHWKHGSFAIFSDVIIAKHMQN